MWCEKKSGLALVLADVLTLSASHPCRKQLSKGIPEPVVRESPAGRGHPANRHLLMAWGETVLPLAQVAALGAGLQPLPHVERDSDYRLFF